DAGFGAPAGWTLIREDQKSTILRQATYVHVVAAAGEPAAYTWTFTYGYGSLGLVVAYSGVDNANPVDAVGGLVTTNSTSVTAPSVVTTVTGDQIVGFFATAIATPITAPTGMTSRIGASRANDTQTNASLAADIPAAAVGATGAFVATAGAVASTIGHTVA